MKFSAADTRRLLELAGHASEPVATRIRPDDGLGMFQLPLPDRGGSTCWSVLIVGWQPTPLNVLMNAYHLVAARKKNNDAVLLAAELCRAGVPRATGRRRVRLEITLGKGQKGPDPDCWWKSTLDGLVRCGALIDDNQKWCEQEKVPRYLRAPERATRIILEDIDPL